MQGNEAVAKLPLPGAIFVVLFPIALWFALNYLTSWVNGWRRLAGVSMRANL
jgi:hypothetical protein